MFIRKTKIRSGSQGEPYFTYRLVESERMGKTVKQRTVLNLGKHFSVEPQHWPLLAARIEQLLQAQSGAVTLFDLGDELNESLESHAQRYAALIIQKQSLPLPAPPVDSRGEAAQKQRANEDFQTVDVNQIELLQARSAGAETLAWQAMQQLQLPQCLATLGFNQVELCIAVGNIIGRAVHPASERETHRWLQQNSALGEFLDYDFGTTSLTRLYTIADKLLANRDAIEAFLSCREQDLFQLERTIVLYDLTNTYFEGRARGNPKARFGRSKEKRYDCPLVTLGLVLDHHGFPLNSRIFEGNVSEPATLEQMVADLHEACDERSPIVILDAGIATKENIQWLVAHNYRYIVVSRQRDRIMPDLEDGAVMIRNAPDNQVIVRSVVCPEDGEIKLYCHSSSRAETEAGIRNRFSQRFEEAVNALNQGLHKKGTVKKYDKVLERVGRLKQKNSRVSSEYRVDVIADENKDKAARIEWKKKDDAAKHDEETGVYCLRTNILDWQEKQLWETWVMLTELEATFRSLKSELGMRPVYHQKEERVTAHLFITLLAYHIVHTLRYQLKDKEIQLSWRSIRNIMSSQQRLTVSLNTKEGDQIYVRTTSRAEVQQQGIYDALGYQSDPIGRKKAVIN